MLKRLGIILCFMIFFLSSPKVLLVRESLSKSLNEDDQLIHVGLGAFQDGFYDIAEKHFSLFIRNFPNHGKTNEVSYLLGRTFLFQGKWNEAKAAFSRLVYDTKTFESIDYALFWMAQIEMKLGNPEASRRWLVSLLKNHPKFEWADLAYYLLGCIDAEANRWNLSEGSFKKVLTLSKREEIVRGASFWLGMASLKQDDAQRATLYLRPFRDESRSLPEAYAKGALCGLGEAQLKLGLYEEAGRTFEAFCERFKQEPLIPDLSWRIGFCAYRSGKLREALQLFRAFQTRFRVPPLLVATHYLLGRVFLAEDDHASSIRAFNQVLQAPQPHLLRGPALAFLQWNYLLANEREEARRVSQKAFKLNLDEDEKSLIQWLTGESLFAEGRVSDALPYYFSTLNSKLRESALFQIGKGYFLENHLREALTNLDLLFLESPNQETLDEGLLIKAESLLRLGDLPRSAETYGQILVLSRKSPWMLIALTQVGFDSLSRGEEENAEKAFERILQDYPGHPLSYHAAFHLGNLYGKRRDYPRASHAYSLVLKGPVPELLGPTYFRIGEILIQQDKEEKALSSFQAVLRSLKTDSRWFEMAQLEIGNLTRRIGNDREAKKSCRAVLDHSRDDQIRKAAGELLQQLEGR